MTYQFKPWDKPTGGKPPDINLVVDEGSSGRRLVFNGSNIALVVTRAATGARQLLAPLTRLVLEPGDEVVRGESHTEDIPGDVVFRARVEGYDRYHSGDERPAGYPRDVYYLHRRVLPDGRVLELLPYSNPRLAISIDGSRTCGYYGEWCFTDTAAAWRAVLGWNGEGDPDGWVRHLNTGRRRPDATPESEYIQW